MLRSPHKGIASLWLLLLSLAPSALAQGPVLRLYTVATLPAASTMNGQTVRVTDSTSALSCTTGGGAIDIDCSSDGSSWSAQPNALADPGSNGLIARTAANTTVARTLQSTSGGAISWTNGNGVSGNPTPSFIFPSKVVYDTAICQGTTALGLLSLPSASTPTANCVTGTNTNYGVLTFTATGQSIQDHMKLPNDWTGAIDVDFVYRSVGTTGNIVWSMQTACVADAATGDPAFNTAQTVSTAAQGTTLRWNTASITSLTTTGCAANNEFHFKPSLSASTTTTGNIDLIAIRFTVRRTL